MPRQPRVRWMVPRDLDYVAGIERESFDIAWSRAEFSHALADRNVFGLVADWNDIIIGYAMVRAENRTMEIINLAIIANRQRQGVGKQLVQRVVELMTEQGLPRVTVDVRETNFQAQVFFRANNFKATNVVSNLYDEVDEDAYHFQFTNGNRQPVNASRPRFVSMANEDRIL